MSAPALLVGCGKMGGALLAGWLARGTSGADAPVIIIEPASAATTAFSGKPGVTVIDDAKEIAADMAPRVVVFAVKPQGMDQVVPAYRRFVSRSTVFLSSAAGRPIAFFERHLGSGAA